MDVGRHHGRHERLRLLKNFRCIDENFAHIRLEQIADRAHHEARFEVNQFGCLDIFCSTVYGFPQLHQVAQVPLQFFGRATDTGSARDHAHAVGDGELVQGFTQLGALVAFDAARDTTAAWIVRHQYQIAARQRNVGGECRALVAALVLLNLNEEFLSDFEVLRNLAARAFAVFALHVLAGQFLEREEAVALCAVVDKYRFERGLHAGNPGFVNIAFTLLLAGVFDIEINELLPVNDGNAQFFCLRCIKQHAFHDSSFSRSFSVRRGRR